MNTPHDQQKPVLRRCLITLATLMAINTTSHAATDGPASMHLII